MSRQMAPAPVAQIPSAGAGPATPTPAATTRKVRVQLEDGSIEEFTVDNRVDQKRLPEVLEGAIRARQKQKKVQVGTSKPEGGVEPPRMAPASTGKGILDFAAGAAQVPVGLARDFVQGAQFINRNLPEVPGLLTEAVRAPLRNVQEGVTNAINMPPEESPPITGAPAAVLQATGLGFLNRLGAGRSAELVNAIPVVGPAATALGQEAAAGHGAEGLGRVTGDTFLNVLAAKGAGSALERARVASASRGPAVVQPAPPKMGPTITPETRRALPEFSGEIQGRGRRAAVPEIPESRIPEPTVTARHGDIPVTSEYPRNVNWAEVGDQLRNAMKNLPDQKAPPKIPGAGAGKAAKSPSVSVQLPPKTLRIPIKILGHFPLSVEISGAKWAALRQLATAARGSTAEAMIIQRIIAGATGDNEDKEGHTRRSENSRNILRLD